MVCYLLIWNELDVVLASGPIARQPQARRRQPVEDLGPVQRGEVAVDAEAQGQFGRGGVQASHDAVNPEALLVPIVGGREEGPVLPVGVELGDDAGRGPVGEGRTRPLLRGHHQPVGVPVPAHREEPLGVRRGQHPAQSQLEDVGRNGAVGQFQLLGNGIQPPHLGGSDQHPRRQVGALGLDVEAAQSENVVKANALAARETGGKVHQVAHRRRHRIRDNSLAALRRPP